MVNVLYINAGTIGRRENTGDMQFKNYSLNATQQQDQ